MCIRDSDTAEQPGNFAPLAHRCTCGPGNHCPVGPVGPVGSIGEYCACCTGCTSQSGGGSILGEAVSDEACAGKPCSVIATIDEH